MRKPQKQLTLDKLPESQTNQNVQPAPEKRIAIKEFAHQTGIDELTLKVSFKLQPSKAAFSKLKADLWFDDQPLPSVLFCIPQGPLPTDELEYKWVLDMAGIATGSYTVKIELYEPAIDKWICYASDEMALDYVPQTRQSRLFRVPTVKSVAGADLAVSSKSEGEIYQEIKDALNREQKSRRDNW